MSDKLPISNDYLIRLAGKPAFNRGMGYFKEGHVLGLKQNGSRVTAEVEGSEIYLVTLKWTSSQLDGACDCPASEGFDFCKHCVAVALTLREAQAEQNKLAQGGTEKRIKAFLLKQDKEKLADWLLELIEAESALLQQWSMRADRDLGIVDVKALKKRITAAIPYNRNLYRYKQVRNYFAQAEIMADQLSEMAEQLPAEDTLKLVDYALQRINRALETIDDSGGFRYVAIETLHIAHINACNRLDWPKKKIANYLLDLLFSEQQDFYPDIPASYADALGDSGMTLFNSTLQAKWDALPPLKQGADYDEKWPYLQLQYMLEQQATLSNDNRAIIKLRQKTATDLYNYQDLAERHLEIGDYDGVKTWLEKCRKHSEKDYHFRTQRIQISLARARELWPEALEQQWTLYTKSQKLDDYLAVLELSEKAGDSQDWQKEAIQFLKKQLQSKTRARWENTTTDNLLEIYLYHKAFEEALALVTKEQVNPTLLLTLAWDINNQPEKAFPLFQQVIENKISLTNNNAYKDAIKLLQEMTEKMQTRIQKQKMKELLEQLRQKFRAKRNFIKWLNEALE
ncbi:MAG: hypothetical protein ACNYZG_06205 [Gammaproteobacteria bacterium]